MDQWAASFEEKSARRRRRNRRAHLVRVTWITIALIALIGAALWGTLNLLELLATF